MDKKGVERGRPVLPDCPKTTRPEVLMSKMRWVDLTTRQKVGVAFLSTIQVGLLAVALWDLAHRRADEVRGDRRLWAGLVFINWVGPLAYFVVGRKEGLFHLFGAESPSGEMADPSAQVQAG
jgi:hypothetical protein